MKLIIFFTSPFFAYLLIEFDFAQILEVNVKVTLNLNLLFYIFHPAVIIILLRSLKLHSFVGTLNSLKFIKISFQVRMELSACRILRQRVRNASRSTLISTPMFHLHPIKPRPPQLIPIHLHSFTAQAQKQCSRLQFIKIKRMQLQMALIYHLHRSKILHDNSSVRKLNISTIDHRFHQHHLQVPTWHIRSHPCFFHLTISSSA